MYIVQNVLIPSASKIPQGAKCANILKSKNNLGGKIF